jgi:DNA-binding transcriptional ArsR family regulator
MKGDAEIRDGRDDSPIFIHSKLDDYGLSPIEFRVYARLARRAGSGQAFESVPSMARDFEVSGRTVQRSLRVLTECSLISETQRRGKSTLYTLNPFRLWKHASQLKAIRTEVFNQKVAVKASASPTGDATDGGDMTVGGGVTSQTGVGVTSQTDEGTPSEIHPQKVFPEEIDINARVDAVFADYCTRVKVVGRTKARLALIKNRLLEGKTEAELHQVWIGALRDPWPERKLHNDIINLLETPERIERMIELSTMELPTRSSNGKSSQHSDKGESENLRRQRENYEHFIGVRPT